MCLLVRSPALNQVGMTFLWQIGRQTDLRVGMIECPNRLGREAPAYSLFYFVPSIAGLRLESAGSSPSQIFRIAS